MSKKAAGLLVLAAGVGVAVMVMRGNAPRVAQKPPFLLDRNTTIYEPVPVDSGFTMNWGNRLDDIFAPFYPEGYSPWKKELENDLNPYGDERIVPYAKDDYLSTSGVSPSLFSDAASMIADAGSSLISVVSLPRGIRNNNPGNLKMARTASGGYVNGANWDGVVPVALNTDKADKNGNRFSQFTNAWYGIRAGAMNVRLKQTRDKLSTLRQICTVYAPAYENDTEAYIRFMSDRLGVKDNAFFDLTSANSYVNLCNLFRLIIKKENSFSYSNDPLFLDACKAVYDGHSCPREFSEWKVASFLNVLPDYSNYA